ncbi:VTT domain-containing protein [Caldisphaera lagunensis]|uniref:VTT domain-containing protein n=1 Tax=Caldisphaera lagunensis TaxID=200415 RepID=UPI00155A8B57|nr:VTT domain-containing protein [Caldisphaera lagunensis]
MLVFWISFISNVIPFGGPPYTIVTATILIQLNYIYFWELIIIASLGAILSKIIIYYSANIFRKPLSKNKNINLISKISNKYLFYIILFILAIIPVLPFDDYLYLAAGAARASLYKMILVTAIAKFSKTIIEILIELKVISLASYIFSISKPDVAILLTALFIIVGIIGFKIDWEKEYNKIKDAIIK